MESSQSSVKDIICKTPPLLPKSLPFAQHWRGSEKLLYDVDTHIKGAFESGGWSFNGNELLVQSSPSQSLERKSLHAFLGVLDIGCAASASGNLVSAGHYWRQGFREIETLVKGQYHDIIPNMIQKINDLNDQGYPEVAVLLRNQIAQSSVNHRSPDRSRWSIFKDLKEIDLGYMVEIEERVMKCYAELFQLYLGQQSYNSFVMLMNAARRKLTRKASARFEECLPPLTPLDDAFGPSNRRPLDVIRLRVEILHLRGMHQETEADAFVLVQRAELIEDDPWQQLYFLTKGWYYVGSAQYSLGKQDMAVENLSNALRYEEDFCKIDDTGLFNPEKVTMLKYLEDLAAGEENGPEDNRIDSSGELRGDA